MRPIHLALASAATCIGLSVGSARGDDLQAPRPRQGYYVAGGAHAALQYAREDDDSPGAQAGWASTVRLGQLLTSRLGLGLAIDLSGASGDDQSAQVAGVGVTGQIELARNLALHAGVGFGVVILSVAGDDETKGGYGASYTLGVSYDWFGTRRRSGGLALSPTLLLRAVPGDGADAFAAFAGLEVTYWTGLPKNQLALPDAEAY
jgi:hypothetical protein